MMIQMEDKNNKEKKGINQSGYKHLYLKIFIAFLLAMASATGCLFIAFAYQGQGQAMILFWSLFLLHMLEIVCTIFCFAVSKADCNLQNKKITLTRIIFIVMIVFLLALLILEAIAWWTPTNSDPSSYTIK